MRWLSVRLPIIAAVKHIHVPSQSPIITAIIARPSQSLIITVIKILYPHHRLWVNRHNINLPNHR